MDPGLDRGATHPIDRSCPTEQGRLSVGFLAREHAEDAKHADAVIHLEPNSPATNAETPLGPSKLLDIRPARVADQTIDGLHDRGPIVIW